LLAFEDFDILKGEVSFLGFEAPPLPSLGEILAGGASNEEVYVFSEFLLA
jgi:ABC-type dipeptide/oligopeptide/nickel transport system permease subunit